MSLLTALHPRNFFTALRDIDTAAAAERAARANPDHRPAIMLMTVAVSLLLIHYLKFSTSFQTFLVWWAGTTQDDPYRWLALLHRSPFFELAAHAWWGFWHVIGYVLLPVLVIRGMFRERVADYGLGLGELHRHIKWYVLLLAPVLVFVTLVSYRQDFATHYPFYRLAGRSWLDLVLWEVIYLLQFVCLEFFFRGFMLVSARAAFGANAVFVMVVPYLMIHFAKPWLEASGAILFGLFLGVLALRSRSIWGGVAVHAGVALSMDLAALVQAGRLPRVWLPF